MMSQHEVTRLRRQMQRRIRVLLAQRRLAASDPELRSGQPANAREPASSGQPAPED